MSAVTSLARLREMGVIVSAEGGELNLRGPRSALTPATLNELRAHKSELLKILTQADPAERIESWLCVADKPQPR